MLMNATTMVGSPGPTTFPFGQAAAQFLVILSFTPWLGNPLQQQQQQQEYGLNRLDAENRGAPVAVSHAAAALLAKDHFNNRDDAVVPHLHHRLENCPHVQVAEPQILDDNGGDPDAVAQALIDLLVHDAVVASKHDNEATAAAASSLRGIIGPSSNLVANRVSAFATSSNIPLVSHEADDIFLTDRTERRHVILASFDVYAQGLASVSWLRQNGRHDFCAVLYVAAQPYGRQVAQALLYAGKKSGFQHIQSFPIAMPIVEEEVDDDAAASLKSIHVGNAMRSILKSGYRNIFLALADSDQLLLPIIADYAEEYEMNQGDYVWMVAPSLDKAMVARLAVSNANVSKLVHGMAVVSALDGFTYHTALEQPDPFLQQWHQQDANFVKRINALLPIQDPTQPGYYQLEPTYFSDYGPAPGSSFMYDAVMLQALGLCEQQNRRPSRPGEENSRVDAILSLDIEGASGRLQFRERKNNPGSRDSSSGIYGVYNFRAAATELAVHQKTWFYLTDVLTGGTLNGTWTPTVHYAPFVFANGLPTPPERNYYAREQNLVSNYIHVVSLVCFGISAFLSCSALVLCFQYRKTKALDPYQPPFMALMSFGCLLLSLAIFTFSFDEGQGWSDRMLDWACGSSVWLTTLGYNAIYSSLACKLWRINKIFQFQRAKVPTSVALEYFAAAAFFNIAVLAVWTFLHPFHWERRRINNETLEEYGQCESAGSTIYLTIIAGIKVVTTFVGALTAWKTRNIDPRFSETNWILYTIVVHIQLFVLGIPILVVLDTASADTTYLTRSIVLSSLVTTTLGFIMGPKAAKIFGFIQPNQQSSSSSRNLTLGETRISGIDQPSGNSSRCSSLGGHNSDLELGPLNTSARCCKGSTAQQTDHSTKSSSSTATTLASPIQSTACLTPHSSKHHHGKGATPPLSEHSERHGIVELSHRSSGRLSASPSIMRRPTLYKTTSSLSSSTFTHTTIASVATSHTEEDDHYQSPTRVVAIFPVPSSSDRSGMQQQQTLSPLPFAYQPGAPIVLSSSSSSITNSWIPRLWTATTQVPQEVDEEQESGSLAEDVTPHPRSTEKVENAGDSAKPTMVVVVGDGNNVGDHSKSPSVLIKKTTTTAAPLPLRASAATARSLLLNPPCDEETPSPIGHTSDNPPALVDDDEDFHQNGTCSRNDK